MVPIQYNVRSLFVRKATTIATALGIALVVFVLTGSAMLSAGISKTLVSSGRSENAIVIRKGADSELSSTVESSFVSLVLASPGVKRDTTGLPLGAGEVMVVIAADLKDIPGQIGNVAVRGVTENVLKIRPEAKIIAGRPAQPGTDEVIVGKGIIGRYKDIELGSRFDLKKNRPVNVVGVFEAGGSSLESEVWADIETARSSFGREGIVSSILVQLESPAKLEAFKLAVEGDKRLDLQAMAEKAYYAKASEDTAKFFQILGMVISFFFSVGAMIGATITMHAAVAQRSREIGTLRALGFSKFSILTSFLLESILLALGGGVIGLLAALILSTQKISMMNFATWQVVTFGFDPAPDALLRGLLFGAVMGLIGGFFPALRAVRISPVDAMRA